MSRLEQALELTSYGKRLAEQEAEVAAAAESLKQLGQDLTRERLLELLIQAPGPDRVLALAGLARPALDYAFFQLLSDRIDTAPGDGEGQADGRSASSCSSSRSSSTASRRRGAAQSASVLRSIIERARPRPGAGRRPCPTSTICSWGSWRPICRRPASATTPPRWQRWRRSIAGCVRSLNARCPPV